MREDRKEQFREFQSGEGREKEKPEARTTQRVRDTVIPQLHIFLSPCWELWGLGGSEPQPRTSPERLSEIPSPSSKKAFRLILNQKHLGF